MSIIITGLEMPVERESFNLTIKYNGIVLDTETGIQVAEAYELPSHGRLCDLDALIKSLELELKRHNSKQFTANWNDACLCVLEAPVVIEAEEGET